MKRTLKLKRKRSIKLRDLTVPKDYSLQKVGITQSMMIRWQQCRMKFLLSINRLENKIKKKTTSFGTMTHDVLKDLYQYKNPTVKIINNIISQYKDTEYDLKRDELELQKVKLSAVLEVYIQIYADEFKSKSMTNMEQVFTTNFKGCKLVIKIDGILETNKNSTEMSYRYLLDHKTMGAIDEEVLDSKLSYDFQGLYYITVLESYKPAIPFRGMKYNIIRNPRSKPKKVKGKTETLKEFRTRFVKEIRANPEHYFKRYTIPFIRQEKEDYKIDLYEKLNELEHLLKGRLKIFKSENACTSGYYNCEYLETCARGDIGLLRKRKEFFPELTK